MFPRLTQIFSFIIWLKFDLTLSILLSMHSSYSGINSLFDDLSGSSSISKRPASSSANSNSSALRNSFTAQQQHMISVIGQGKYQPYTQQNSDGNNVNVTKQTYIVANHTHYSSHSQMNANSNSYSNSNNIVSRQKQPPQFLQTSQTQTLPKQLQQNSNYVSGLNNSGSYSYGNNNPNAGNSNSGGGSIAGAVQNLFSQNVSV